MIQKELKLFIGSNHVPVHFVNILIIAFLLYEDETYESFFVA